MPTRAFTPCSQPGCPTLVDHPGRCAEHIRTKDRRRGTAAARGYDTRWQQLRASHLHREPLCRRCGRPATDVDHMDNLGPHGPRGRDPANLQSLCHACHARKTAVESSRWAAAERDR